MTISATTPVFPNNIVDILHLRTTMLDPQLAVLKRPLRSSDPVQCVGIVPVQWTPDPDSTEMMGMQSYGPTIGEYVIGIQAFVKDMDEERGLATHSVLSKMIRSMLYRDHTLRVGLGSLSVTMNDSTERAKRWGIRRQGYVNNEISGSFHYLSTLEFWLETETT